VRGRALIELAIRLAESARIHLQESQVRRKIDAVRRPLCAHMPNGTERVRAMALLEATGGLPCR